MNLGIIGLGRMGSNMAERLKQAGHDVLGYALHEESRQSAREKGIQVVDSLQEMVKQLETPRAVWVMVPAGEATEETVNQLADLLDEGDVIVDGGNSNFRDSIRRAQSLKEKGLSFLDAGTSGGVWGLKIGYCLMVGGEKEIFEKLEPIFAALAPKDGYAHVGPSGAGHFVKMIHNGIEYALLQAYAEGFQLMEANSDFDLDLPGIAHLWNQGSVVRSWLLELAESAFGKDPHLDAIKGYVDDSGEGRWTVEEAIKQSIPAPVITLSLLERFRSRQKESFSAKVIAALRNEFGGHAVKKKKDG